MKSPFVLPPRHTAPRFPLPSPPFPLNKQRFISSQTQAGGKLLDAGGGCGKNSHSPLVTGMRNDIKTKVDALL